MNRLRNLKIYFLRKYSSSLFLKNVLSMPIFQIKIQRELRKNKYYMKFVEYVPTAIGCNTSCFDCKYWTTLKKITLTNTLAYFTAASVMKEKGLFRLTLVFTFNQLTNAYLHGTKLSQ
jgi:hypothetical protein